MCIFLQCLWRHMHCAAMKRGAKQQNWQYCLSFGDVSSVLIYSRTTPETSELWFHIQSFQNSWRLTRYFISLSSVFCICSMWTCSLLGVDLFPVQGWYLMKRVSGAIAFAPKGSLATALLRAFDALVTRHGNAMLSQGITTSLEDLSVLLQG